MNSIMPYVITFVMCYFAAFIGYWWGKGQLQFFRWDQVLFDGWEWRVCCGLIGVFIHINLSTMFDSADVMQKSNDSINGSIMENMPTEFMESDFDPTIIIGYPLPDNYVDDEIHS